MSIAFAMSESKSTLEQIREERLRAGATRKTSAARVEANRWNSRKSTGPRTAEGKRRASRNAMKHGLCRTLSCLPSECEATFLTFVSELEAELRPATPLQRITFNQIASLTWRLQRLPEAQSKVFNEELQKVDAAEGEELKPSDVLARRFSDAPSSNGFALMERYERGMRSQLLRLMKHYEQLQKHRATAPYDKDEPPCPDEGKQPAWTEQKAQAQRAWFAEQGRLHAEGKTADPEWVRLREIHQEQLEDAAREASGAAPRSVSTPALPNTAQQVLRVVAKRTQSKSTENFDSALPAGKCAIADTSPVTKRTQPGGDPQPSCVAIQGGGESTAGAVANRPRTRKMPHL